MTATSVIVTELITDALEYSLQQTQKKKNHAREIEPVTWKRTFRALRRGDPFDNVFLIKPMGVFFPQYKVIPFYTDFTRGLSSRKRDVHTTLGARRVSSRLTTVAGARSNVKTKKLK